MHQVLVPLGLFLMVFGISLTVVYFRFRTRREVQQTLRAALESGQPMSPELLEELARAATPPQADLRRGMMGIALGLAVVAFALLLGEADARGPLFGLAAFPFLVGAAYLLLSRLNQSRSTSADGG